MKIVAIVGATGVGKSEFALQLAGTFSKHGITAEVVNADAMQQYRGMNIGTAKLMLDERLGIPHHLLDILDVTDEASAAQYQTRARATIDAINDRNAIALLVGGSGLYVSSVIHDFSFPGTDPVVRARLEAELETLGSANLHSRLRSFDEQTAKAIDSRNGRRVIRALEIIELTGQPTSARLPEKPVAWRLHTVINLRTDREELVARLNSRVANMWQNGLLAEVEGLIPLGIEDGITASKAIGYAQALAQIRGRMSRDDAIAETQQLTRIYARRQVSWFKRYPGSIEANLSQSGSREDAIKTALQKTINNSI